jgi:hypothetical protein
MAIEGLDDLSSLDLSELYAVYRKIAESDMNWRLRTMYGDRKPEIQFQFRPLSFEVFQERYEAACELEHGASMLRERLSRQAAAYRVDVDLAVARLQRAA